MIRSNVIVALLLASIFAAMPALAVGTQPSDEDNLKRLSFAWMQAIEAKDARTLDAILAPDYVLLMAGDRESQYTHRDEWMTNAIKKDWSNFRYEQLVVRVNGDNATVSSRLYFKIAPIPLTFDSGVVDTWVKHDGKWQVTARYLGQSNMQERVTFIFGLLTALVFVALVYGLTKLLKRKTSMRSN